MASNDPNETVQEFADALKDLSKSLAESAGQFRQAVSSKPKTDIVALATVLGQTLEHVAFLYSISAEVILSIPKVSGALGEKLAEVRVQLDRVTKISPNQMYR